ncbi:MAG TPA: hypothetical protein VNA21_12285 [Steroidobacteraceae bacterium]|nr:hypothetical protein [Steroidobacteraceae bacterium]
MSESRELQKARGHLARAETQFSTASGYAELEQGLGLLAELIEADTRESVVANNLAASYATKIFTRVDATLAKDRAVPQPLLEHFFKLMLAFDQGEFVLPESAGELKIKVVRHLIDLAYEGHPAEAKRKALERLRQITGNED